MTKAHDSATKMVYWHRELAPLASEQVGEHTIEATSGRVPGTLDHRDDLWDRCYRELITNTERRLVEEVRRLGGHYAHIHGESITPKRDDAVGEAWLSGRFTYMAYRRHLELTATPPIAGKRQTGALSMANPASVATLHAGDVLVSHSTAVREHDISIVPRAPHATSPTHDAAVVDARSEARALGVDAWLSEDHTHVVQIASNRPTEK